MIMFTVIRKRACYFLYKRDYINLSNLFKNKNVFLRLTNVMIVSNNSSYKRPALKEGPHPSRYHPIPGNEAVDENIRSFLSKRKVLNIEEWENYRIEVQTDWHFITEENFGSIIMNNLLELNELNLAHSFIKYLEQTNIKPNFLTYLKYISICARNYRLIDQDLIPKTFDKIQNLIDKSPILDQKSILYIVQGLCATNKWKISFEYLKKSPQKPLVETYCTIACAAIRNNENIGWEILTKWLKNGEIPSDVIIEEFFLFALELQKSKPLEADLFIRKLLSYMQTKSIIISIHNVKLLEKYFICHRSKWLTSYTKVNRLGMCENCGCNLKFAELSDHEFSYLTNAFLEKVVKKSDVFINSTKSEFNKYIEFIEKNKPFHVIIDGLNAAYTYYYNKSPKNLAFHLSKVVKILSGKSKKLLVMGRKHMLKWPSYPMKKIEERAKLFYTDNISQDDPFAIYAALASGPHTLILSDDLMRDHLSRLDDPKAMQLFKKWQLSHQLFLKTDKDNSIKIIEPVRHSITIHGSMDKGFHIPFDDKIILDPYEELNNWLCILKDLEF